MQVAVTLPKWGLTMTEATIVNWLCRPGDTVKEGDALVEVETDKVNSEVPAPDAGVVVRIVGDVGTSVAVGQVLAVLEVAGEEPPGEYKSAQASPDQPIAAVSAASASEVVPQRAANDTGVRASPLARRIARELGVDIAFVKGTGPEGLITEADVRTAATAQRTAGLRPASVEKLSPMRAAIAAAMMNSLAQSAQLTITREADIAGLVASRKLAPGDAGFTDVLLAAVGRTLTRHPRLNAHLSDGELRLYDTVNIGLAVALEDGLVVPVIRDAARRSLREIAAERRRLVDRARARNLTPADMEGGTFTLTNLGPYGVDTFTPILRIPEVAILGAGSVKPRATVVQGTLAVRDSCPLSLTFDHRALDGAPASRFLADLAELLADPGRMKEEIV